MRPIYVFRILLIILFLTSVAVQLGAQTAAQSSEPAKPISGSASGKLVISGGDLLRISVMGAPEFDQDLRVSDSGQITLPYVGSVNLAGLSTAEAQQLVAKELRDSNVFVQPQVSLFIKEYATLGISVVGEVQKPGVYPLLGAHTLFDAISVAGGVTAKAGRAVTISHRNSPEKMNTVFMNNGPNGEVSGNVPISAGDTIVVSKAGMVYVVGDVRQPTGIVLENPDLTVLQAIAIAQGANSTASLDKAKLLRKSSSGVQEIPIPVKQILAAKKPDVTMKPEDVLFIPSSAAKGATRRGLEAILQAATGVAIYRR